MAPLPQTTAHQKGIKESIISPNQVNLASFMLREECTAMTHSTLQSKYQTSLRSCQEIYRFFE
ncbi:MAG: hypothetical protein MHPSP_002077 [Paramarteilia canceri]